MIKDLPSKILLTDPWTGGLTRHPQLSKESFIQGLAKRLSKSSTKPDNLSSITRSTWWKERKKFLNFLSLDGCTQHTHTQHTLVGTHSNKIKTIHSWSRYWTPSMPPGHCVNQNYLQVSQEFQNSSNSMWAAGKAGLKQITTHMLHASEYRASPRGCLWVWLDLS